MSPPSPKLRRAAFAVMLDASRSAAGAKTGAGDGNRTRVCSLGSCRSTIELRPQSRFEIYPLFGLLSPECWAIPPSRFRARGFPTRGISRYNHGMTTRKPEPNKKPAGAPVGRQAGAQDVASRCGAYRDRRILAGSAGGHRPHRQAQGGAPGARCRGRAAEGRAQEDPAHPGSSQVLGSSQDLPASPLGNMRS